LSLSRGFVFVLGESQRAFGHSAATERRHREARRLLGVAFQARPERRERIATADGRPQVCVGLLVTIRLTARAEPLTPPWLFRWVAPVDRRLLVGSATRRRP
jgi:hypothetical protein